MAAQVLEGTWEEIARHSAELAGKTLSLTILSDALSTDILTRKTQTANEEVRAALNKIMARQAGVREADQYRLAGPGETSDAHSEKSDA